MSRSYSIPCDGVWRLGLSDPVWAAVHDAYAAEWLSEGLLAIARYGLINGVLKYAIYRTCAQFDLSVIAPTETVLSVVIHGDGSYTGMYQGRLEYVAYTGSNPPTLNNFHNFGTSPIAPPSYLVCEEDMGIQALFSSMFNGAGEIIVQNAVTREGMALIGFRCGLDVDDEEPDEDEEYQAAWDLWLEIETDGVSPEPTVDSCDPDSAARSATLDVVITGADFIDATAVSFGAGIAVNSFVVDNNWQITANITVAANAAGGHRNVSVTTPSGTGVGLSLFTVLSFAAFDCDPWGAYRDDTLDVGINGLTLTDVTAVSFGAGITVNDFDVDSDTHITANITIAADAAYGMRAVSVTDPVLGTAVTDDLFEVLMKTPEIYSCSPSGAYRGDTLDIDINGLFFTGATAVSLGAGITVNSFIVDPEAPDYWIHANITIQAGAALGLRSVSVTTPIATAVALNLFEVLAYTPPAGSTGTIAIFRAVPICVSCVS